MSIEFKIAATPREIDDALWLRHQVYLVEEGRFGGKPLPSERLVDRYDVMPKVAHLIVYNDDEPIAGMRMNCDQGGGLPPEEHFDFNPFLPPRQQHAGSVLASGGMLVVRREWRKRRDIFAPLFRLSASVFFNWRTTQIIATVSEDTALIYRRIGFQPVSRPLWVESIGDMIVPMVAPAEKCYALAFGTQKVMSKARIAREPARFDDLTSKTVASRR